ncbi:uncharacterized protein BDCG_16954 [Blastomyces dermatitidis ER-3]|uniref:Uncharacterized protein n=1 Tax=Ajellomyces dermatitidis (strain ER-3 / ATCC MYA-2586) TaxID=559297 RepID=A0ABX2VWR1_AJEDR|nr:uncharacterized protein BDCG_16954 [Blastomyces dermatitidis ER-3]OAT01188.1 hypothetical protein BDCG_16954 [Blastomyces dermatitidis ER-3]
MGSNVKFMVPAASLVMPLSSINTVAYDPVFSSVTHLSPAQNAAELSLQSSVISSSSLYEKALMQSLISITTYLHCIKQLKKKRILYTYLFSHFYYFCYTGNNDFYLSYRVRVSELQVLTDSIKTEKVLLTYLQKKMKV